MKLKQLFLLSACLIIASKTYASQEIKVEASCHSSDSKCIELQFSNANYNKKSLLRMRNTGMVQKTSKTGFFWSLSGIFLGLLIGIPLMIIAADFAVMGASFMLSFGHGFASPIMFLPSLGVSGIVIL